MQQLFVWHLFSAVIASAHFASMINKYSLFLTERNIQNYHHHHQSLAVHCCNSEPQETFPLNSLGVILCLLLATNFSLLSLHFASGIYATLHRRGVQAVSLLVH